MELAEQVFKQFYTTLSESDTTDKQALAAALILTADQLVTDWIFKDGRAITTAEIAKFLQSKAAVSVNQRAYEYLCEYVIQNKNKFCGESIDTEVWGKIPDGGREVWIVRREFDRICADAGYNGKALLSWLRDNGKLELGTKGLTKTKRINGIPCGCVVILFPEDEPKSDEEYELIADMYEDV